LAALEPQKRCDLWGRLEAFLCIAKKFRTEDSFSQVIQWTISRLE
jgi:hypothetical protein